MKKTFTSASRYIQGPGIINEIGHEVISLGDVALIVAGKTAFLEIGNEVTSSLTQNKVNYFIEHCEGLCTKREITNLVKTAEKHQANLIIGIGGGKIIDTAKSLAYIIGSPIVLLPTVASTNAAWSAASVIYSEKGSVEDYLFMRRNPDLVYVDTDVIARSPVRLLVAGIGDALATKFEAEACYISNSRNISGGLATLTAIEIASLCYDTLLSYGYLAKLSCENNVSSPALEKVVEAILLQSGIGFESSGLAAAHAIHDGFTELAETHDKYHGEIVSFCTFVQLIMENKPTSKINEFLSFCKSVELPITLGEININSDISEELMKVSNAVVKNSYMKNMPFPVNSNIVFNAITLADSLGQEFYRKRKI